MISWLCLKLKQLFCRHKTIYFKEASALEKYHWKYGKLICKNCGKVVFCKAKLFFFVGAAYELCNTGIQGSTAVFSTFERVHAEYKLSAIVAAQKEKAVIKRLKALGL